MLRDQDTVGNSWGGQVKGTAGGFSLPGKGGITGPAGRLKQVKGWIHSRVRLGPMARSFLDARPAAQVRVQTVWFHWRV